MKLALGTVQFGLDYGIANQGGQVSFNEATSIIENARRQGIGMLDTAAAYGTSQKVLGQIGIADFKTITKVGPLDRTAGDVRSQVMESVERSLEELQLESLYCVLLHHSADLSGDSGSSVFEALTELRNDSRVQKIGISIYGPEELDTCRFSDALDLVQSPYNVFDQRLRTSGWMAKLRVCGTEIHTRSTFLQGVLLMDPAIRPSYFRKFSACFEKWDNWVQQSGLSPLVASLYPLMLDASIDRIVVGVDSAAQLDQIIGEIGTSMVGLDLPDLASELIDLIDPRSWPNSSKTSVNKT